MNPFAVVPFLELDDGTVIGESIAICRYLEELNPEPSLFGRDPKQRAVVEMWNRRIDLDGFMPIVHAVRNVSPMFKGRVIPGTRTDHAQLSVIVDRGKAQLRILLERLEPHLARNRFVSGDDFSVAEITAHVMLAMAGRIEMTVPPTCPNVARWRDEIGSRPAFES